MMKCVLTQISSCSTMYFYVAPWSLCDRTYTCQKNGQPKSSLKATMKNNYDKERTHGIQYYLQQSCTLFSNPDSTLHSFIQCSVATSLYSDMVQKHSSSKGESFHATDFLYLNRRDLIELTSIQKRKLNLLLLLAKYYIYTCNTLSKKPDVHEFQTNLKSNGGLTPFLSLSLFLLFTMSIVIAPFFSLTVVYFIILSVYCL